jgi:hypothetical protein
LYASGDGVTSLHRIMLSSTVLEDSSTFENSKGERETKLFIADIQCSMRYRQSPVRYRKNIQIAVSNICRSLSKPVVAPYWDPTTGLSVQANAGLAITFFKMETVPVRGSCSPVLRIFNTIRSSY